MRRGITLVELLAVVAIVLLLAAFALPRVNSTLDGIAVRGAAADIVSAFAFARQAAIARMGYVTVRIDSARNAVFVSAGPDTLVKRLVGSVHGVRIKSNRDSLAYNALGHGYGASNQSILVTRGKVSDTVIVSRLGRVRR